MFLILDFTQSLRLTLINKNKSTSKEIKTKKNISEILIFEIEKYLKKSKVSIKNIKSICIITGPGSFTGIRSALTFAKMLKLTSKIDIFGLSKFEIINLKIQTIILNKKNCILIHFRGSQFFIQTFNGCKAIGEAQLIDFEYEKFIYNRELTYIYDNVLFEDFLKKNIREKMKKNFHLVDYSSIELQELILKNTIDKSDPKPLYLSNHY